MELVDPFYSTEIDLNLMLFYSDLGVLHDLTALLASMSSKLKSMSTIGMPPLTALLHITNLRRASLSSHPTPSFLIFNSYTSLEFQFLTILTS